MKPQSVTHRFGGHMKIKFNKTWFVFVKMTTALEKFKCLFLNVNNIQGIFGTLGYCGLNFIIIT